MITVSLETAKKLKEAGWKKETYFVWVEGGKLGQPLRSEVHPTEVMKNRIVLADSAYDSYLAPTAQEILDELPAIISEEHNKKFGTSFLDIAIYGEPKIYRARYDHWGEGDEKDNLVETLAALRIDCKDNDYLLSTT